MELGWFVQSAAERSEGREGYTDVCMHSTAQREDIHFYLERNVGIGYVFPCLVRNKKCKVDLKLTHERISPAKCRTSSACCSGLLYWIF
jgi:hypothetical protein